MPEPFPAGQLCPAIAADRYVLDSSASIPELGVACNLKWDTIVLQIVRTYHCYTQLLEAISSLPSDLEETCLIPQEDRQIRE